MQNFHHATAPTFAINGPNSFYMASFPHEIYPWMTYPNSPGHGNAYPPCERWHIPRGSLSAQPVDPGAYACFWSRRTDRSPFPFPPFLPDRSHLNPPLEQVETVTIRLEDGPVRVSSDILRQNLPKLHEQVMFCPHRDYDIRTFLNSYRSGLGGSEMPSFMPNFRAKISSVVIQLASQQMGRHTTFDLDDLLHQENDLREAGPHVDYVVSRMVWETFLLCCVLDQDRAFGCSNHLGDKACRFLLHLLQCLDQQSSPHLVGMLFQGFARVFNDTALQRAYLEQFWNSLEPESHEDAVRLLRQSLAADPNARSTNTGRMVSALRSLGLVQTAL